jgi:transposase InsO family protein
VRFAFIKDHRATWPVAVQCRVLQVSRAGFYAWLGRPAESSRAAARRELTAAIRAAHAECRQVYGSPRITAELAARGGPTACENTVARAMRDAGIAALRRRRFVPRTTDAAHANPVAPNVLDRDFAADLPDRKWACDITYVPTADDGFLYVAAVMDLCSRRIVGWAMAGHMRATLCLDALDMALAARRPAAGLLHHSDRGVQYTCGDYRAALAAAGATCSMSRTGDCWDNAAMESFWSTLKRELVDGQNYATHDEARRSIFEYIQVFYNRTRRHSAIGYVSPEQFEAALN